MTFEDKQTFEMLDAIVKADFPKPVSFKELSETLGHVIASGEGRIIAKMVTDGLIFETKELPHLYGITLSGRKKHKHLKAQVRWQPFRGIAFWLTFTAAMISAYFAWKTYVKTFPVSKPKSEESKRQDSTEMPSAPQIKAPSDTSPVVPNKNL